MNRIWAALPYIMLAGLVALMCYACINGGEQKIKINIDLEDGLLEWATVTMFGMCCILGIISAAENRKILAKRQIIFLLVFAAICFVGGAEELDWGKRIFGFDVPKGMESHSDSAIRFGHDSTSIHNLKFKKWGINVSIGGMLFGPVLIVALGIHGILLPILVKKKNPKTLKLVEKTGVFIPPMHLGILVTAATLCFYILRKTPVNDYTQPNEFKEFFVVFVYACMLVCIFLREDTPAKIAAKVFTLLLTAGLLALCFRTM